MDPLARETVTIITMYRGSDSEMFTQVVDNYLTEEQKDKWRKVHSCDNYSPKDEDGFACNNLFFRELNIKDATQTYDLVNVDGKHLAGRTN